MKQLKRTILLAAGLAVLSAAATAAAQGPAPAPASGKPATAAPGASKPGLPGPRAELHGGKAAERGPGAHDLAKSMHAKPGATDKPGAVEPGAGEPPKRAVVTKGAPLGKLPKEARRSRLTAMREFKRAEREQKMAQKARLEGGDGAEKAILEAEARAEAANRKGFAALLKTQQARARADKPLTSQERQAVVAQLKAASAKRAADRKERGDARRKELKKEFGAKLSQPAIVSELRRHAWRVARLTRVIEVADAMGRDGVSAKATRLLAMESTKHALRLQAFAAGKLELDVPTAPGTSAGAIKPTGPISPAAKAPAASPGLPMKPKALGAAPAAPKEGAQ